MTNPKRRVSPRRTENTQRPSNGRKAKHRRKSRNSSGHKRKNRRSGRSPGVYDERTRIALVAALLGKTKMRVLEQDHPINSEYPWPAVLLDAYNGTDDPGLAAHNLNNVYPF